MTRTITSPAPSNRWVRLDGALNFRDLGGYLTRSGMIIAWRRLYRSDTLDTLTGVDRESLVRDVGLRTAVDLRCPDECRPVERLSGATHSVPLLDVTGSDPIAVPGVGLADVYLHILRTRGGAIREVLELVADAAHPLVFHCGAGKDRTGLVAAVLLGVLGVTDDDIVRDYVLSQAVLAELMARLLATSQSAGIALPPQAHAASADTMRLVLRRLNQDHGSVLGYALDAGVDPSVIEVLKDRLLA